MNEVSWFIGLVNYYQDMWERCSHALAYLTKIKFSKVKFKWTEIEQDDFKKKKWIVARILY